MTQVIDQYSDPVLSHLYQQIKEMPAIEEQVKTAHIDPRDKQELPDTAFAWEEKRAFPIHDREHAVMSYAYYLGADEGVQKEASRYDVKAKIEGALGVFDVPPETFAREKRAFEEPQDHYLLPEIKRILVSRPEHVKEAEASLKRNERKIPFNQLVPAYARLVKRAQDLGEDVSVDTHKMAGMTQCDPHIVKDWVEARAEACREPLVAAGFSKIASELDKERYIWTDREKMLKLATVISDLDERGGLQEHYGRKLPNPLRTVFNQEKIAGPAMEIEGQDVPMEELLGQSPEFWGDLVGPDMVAEVAPGGQVDPQALEQVIATLPADIKMVLLKQLGY